MNQIIFDYVWRSQVQRQFEEQSRLFLKEEEVPRVSAAALATTSSKNEAYHASRMS